MFCTETKSVPVCRAAHWVKPRPSSVHLSLPVPCSWKIYCAVLASLHLFNMFFNSCNDLIQWIFYMMLTSAVEWNTHSNLVLHLRFALLYVANFVHLSTLTVSIGYRCWIILIRCLDLNITRKSNHLLLFKCASRYFTCWLVCNNYISSCYASGN